MTDDLKTDEPVTETETPSDVSGSSGSNEAVLENNAQESKDAQESAGVQESTGTKQESRVRLRSAVAVAAILLALLVAGCIGACVYEFNRMVERIHAAATSMESDFTVLQEQINNQDFAGAAQTAHKVSETTDELVLRTDLWIWDFARNIPIIGPDVTCALGLIDVVDDLSDEVVVPLTDKINELVSTGVMDGEGINLDGVGTSLSTLSDFVTLLDDSRTRVVGYKARLDSLEASHSAELQEALDKSRDGIAKLDGIFVDAGEVIDTAVSAKDAIDSFEHAFGSAGDTLDGLRLLLEGLLSG